MIRSEVSAGSAEVANEYTCQTLISIRKLNAYSPSASPSC